jgi:hypothetical protein
MGSLRRWLAGVLAALALIAAVDAAAEESSCENPITPGSACHSPERARNLAKWLADAWVASASAKAFSSPVPASPSTLRFAKASYDIYRDGCH